MKKTDIRKNFRTVRWTTEHTVTPEQFKLMIAEKYERARQASLALKQREARVGGR